MNLNIGPQKYSDLPRILSQALSEEQVVSDIHKDRILFQKEGIISYNLDETQRTLLERQEKILQESQEIKENYWLDRDTY